MPLAKLSERFYDKFGHDLVEELVTWLNQMDTTYRADLRELNELNFARFDAKLDQRLAEVKADLVKWMLGIWLAAVPAFAGVVVLVQHFLPPHP